MKNIIWILVGMTLSFSVFANNEKPITCKDFRTLEIRQPIKTLDQNFQWDSPNCKIVATKSIFPKKDKNGNNQFEKGLQIFIYQDNQLKFICLPGWTCKSWAT
jgi:hypothetical protein